MEGGEPSVSSSQNNQNGEIDFNSSPTKQDSIP